MKLSELLISDLVLVPFEAADKWAAIAGLARAAVEARVLPASKLAAVQTALEARERSMTTGMEHGVAIPHAAVDGIADVIAVLAISQRGIGFDSLDREPARILVCLIIPREKKLFHIKTLAEIAKLLSRPAVRARLHGCGTPAEALAAVREEEK
jgi:mannitol/fructose-specific phosphotransferase system IIA component (Ntr-type)